MRAKQLFVLAVLTADAVSNLWGSAVLPAQGVIPGAGSHARATTEVPEPPIFALLALGGALSAWGLSRNFTKVFKRKQD